MNLRGTPSSPRILRDIEDFFALCKSPVIRARFVMALCELLKARGYLKSFELNAEKVLEVRD